MRFLRELFFGTVVLVSSLASGGEGTLPFGLPVEMRGQTTEGDATQKPLQISFDTSRVTLLEADSSSECPSGMASFKPRGSITYDNKTIYRVTAICAPSSGSGNDRIIVGQKGSESITLNGSVSTQPGFQVFEGRAQLTRNSRVIREMTFSLTE